MDQLFELAAIVVDEFAAQADSSAAIADSLALLEQG